MHPVLHTFHLGGREVALHAYGVLIALGFALGIALAWREGRRKGLDGGQLLDLAFWILVSGLLGSRLLYVAINVGEFARACAGDGTPRTVGRALADCSRILHVWEGGLVFYGGALAAAGVTALYVRRRGWAFWTVGDVFAPSLAMGHVFGRLGCFAAGCCFGKSCAAPWAASFPRGSVAYDELRAAGQSLGATTPPLHPTQLYEAAGELALFVGLLFVRRRQQRAADAGRPAPPGQVLLAYAIGYPILRMAVEVFRGDVARRYVVEIATPGLARALGLPPAEPLFLSLGQLVSIMVVAAAARALHRRSRARAAAPPTPEAPP